MDELEQAYRAVEARSDFPPGARLSEINAEALRQWEHTWRTSPHRLELFPISDEIDRLKKQPSYFDMATWVDNRLEAISSGIVVGGNNLRLELIEAVPEHKTINAFKITDQFLRRYAEIIGATEIRIMEPINTKVRNYYCSFGYTYHNGGDYCGVIL
ncbi:MAG: hypothetical protein HRU20_21255 [Pseudomonadales bacterium]|nr:hypothetical protein [Pseudomonadales bacterium]